MKRTILIFMCCLVAVVATMFCGMSYFSSWVFGEKTKEICSEKVLTTLSIEGSNASLVIIDNACDDGIVVSGAFKVVLRHEKNDHVIETVLLSQSNMGADASPPTVKAIARFVFELSGNKNMVVELGPKEVDGFKFQYKLK